MRFYLDEMFSEALAAAARARGRDVTSTIGVQRRGADDETQLLYAASEARCVVTENGEDFERLGTLFHERGLPHAGVLVVSPSLEGRAYEAIVDRLAHWHDRYPDGTPAYFFGYL